MLRLERREAGKKMSQKRGVEKGAVTTEKGERAEKAKAVKNHVEGTRQKRL